MSIVAKSLADGQLPAAKGTLYTSVGITYVRFIRCHNTSGANTETVVIYLNRGGGSRIIMYNDALGPHYTMGDDPHLTMAAGDILEGVSTHATNTDYVITGATA
jgi:hypothetical protein